MRTTYGWLRGKQWQPLPFFSSSLCKPCLLFSFSSRLRGGALLRRRTSVLPEAGWRLCLRDAYQQGGAERCAHVRRRRLTEKEGGQREQNIAGGPKSPWRAASAWRDIQR